VTAVGRFLTRRQNDGRQGARRWTVADVLTYGYLVTGILVMFGPVAWLVLSSFKTQANLLEFPPTLLPLAQQTATVDGYPSPLPLFDVALEDGSVVRLAQVRRVGLQAQMVDPADPGEIVRVAIDQRTPVRVFRLATENFTESFSRFNFATYLRNSDDPDQRHPGARLPGHHPGGVDQQPVGRDHPGGRHPNGRVPLASVHADDPGRAARLRPHRRRLGVAHLLADRAAAGRAGAGGPGHLLGHVARPLIVLTRSEFFTLQVGLNAFQGELNVQWHYVLAMTVLTLLPITVVFSLLQRFITTGIASTGVKG